MRFVLSSPSPYSLSLEQQVVTAGGTHSQSERGEHCLPFLTKTKVHAVSNFVTFHVEHSRTFHVEHGVTGVTFFAHTLYIQDEILVGYKYSPFTYIRMGEIWG